MTWFESLTGVPEFPRSEMYSRLSMKGGKLVTANGEFEAGKFTLPLLTDLRANTSTAGSGKRSQICEVVADVNALHNSIENQHSVFQVASQFNCLEMAAPHLRPEDGVGIYEDDFTQGPACSICCGAGTIFRNYFVELNEQKGQSANNQVDCLSTIGRYFENSEKELWEMQNGYCFPTASGLATIEDRLSGMSDEELDVVRGKLRVGLQSKTAVTTSDSRHLVSQVFCSALPVAYSRLPATKWNHFPRLILDATYEATFYLALQNMVDTGCNNLFLTLVGGGVFGNRVEWILSAIERAFKLFEHSSLNVQIVSYRRSNPAVAELARRMSR